MHEALRLHVKGLVEDGETISGSRSLAECSFVAWSEATAPDPLDPP